MTQESVIQRRLADVTARKAAEVSNRKRVSYNVRPDEVQTLAGRQRLIGLAAMKAAGLDVEKEAKTFHEDGANGHFQPKPPAEPVEPE